MMVIRYFKRSRKIRVRQLQDDGTYKRVWDWCGHTEDVYVHQLEADMPDTDIQWLESILTKVELPPEPDCCGNCEHADCGNHGDEMPFCQLFEYYSSTLLYTSICPLHKRNKRYK